VRRRGRQRRGKNESVSRLFESFRKLSTMRFPQRGQDCMLLELPSEIDDGEKARGGSRGRVERDEPFDDDEGS